MLENQCTFLRMLADRSIYLVNIGGEDLVEGNPKLVLGLTWTLIQRYEMHKFGAVEKDVLAWASETYRRCSGGKEMASGGWGEAFADGQALCYLVHDAAPDAINLEATRCATQKYFPGSTHGTATDPHTPVHAHPPPPSSALPSRGLYAGI